MQGKGIRMKGAAAIAATPVPCQSDLGHSTSDKSDRSCSKQSKALFIVFPSFPPTFKRTYTGSRISRGLKDVNICSVLLLPLLFFFLLQKPVLIEPEFYLQSLLLFRVVPFLPHAPTNILFLRSSLFSRH